MTTANPNNSDAPNDLSRSGHDPHQDAASPSVTAAEQHTDIASLVDEHGPRPGRPSVRRRFRGVVVASVALLAAVAWLLILGVLSGPDGVAPTPAVFQTSTSLDAAATMASDADKPLLAVVTADWCPPCQWYKREALADERVHAIISSELVAVMIDADARPTDAQRLGARQIPTTVLLRDGETVDGFTGPADANELLDWLERNGVGADVD